MNYIVKTEDVGIFWVLLGTEFAKITVSGYILGSNSEISNV